MLEYSRVKKLPLATVISAAAALVLRILLYTFALDEKNLLVAHHPLKLALGVLTAGALLLIVVCVWKLGGSDIYADNFSPSVPAFIGHTAAGAGILITVLTYYPATPGYLGAAWNLLGYAAPVCLFLAGYQRMAGKQPFFLLHVVPCLFYAVHVVSHYQLWCSNPQIQDYLYALLATIALTLFGFYHAAFGADAGNRRMLLGTGLAAAFLCITELAATGYTYLYLGGAIWALTSLCHLIPLPKKEDPNEE